MIFQNPYAWLLLPLVLLPFLLNLSLFNRRRIVVLPSLYFFNQLAKKKKFYLRKLPWLLVLLESLFFLSIITLIAQPTIPTFSNQKNKLLVLIDDSLSMNYYFLKNNRDHNPLYHWLKNSIEQGTYQKIEMKKLSDLRHRQTIGIDSLEKLDFYFDRLKSEENSWKAKDLEIFFRLLQSTKEIEQYDFLLFSDFKKNHFVSPTDSSVFPPVLFLLATEERVPVLDQIEVGRRNYFDQEILSVPFRLLPFGKDVFLEARLNGDVVFYKKFLSNQFTNVFQGAIQVPLNASTVLPSKSSEFISSGMTEQNLELLLKYQDLPFQSYWERIHVFPKKKIGVPVGKKDLDNFASFRKKEKFINSLFAYDLRKNHVALRKMEQNLETDVDTLMIFFPFREFDELNKVDKGGSFVKEIKSFSEPFGGGWKDIKINPQKTYLLFFAPYQSSILPINQLLQKWNFDLRIKETKFIHSSDTLKFNFYQGDHKSTRLIDLSRENEITLERYFTFYGEMTSIEPILLVNEEPVIFRYKNIVFFNVFLPFNLSKAIRPEYLTWIYEGIFYLWRKENPLDKVNNEAEFFLPSAKILTETVSPRLVNLDDFLHSAQFLEKILSRETTENFLDLVQWLLWFQLILFLFIGFMIFKKISIFSR